MEPNSDSGRASKQGAFNWWLWLQQLVTVWMPNRVYDVTVITGELARIG